MQEPKVILARERFELTLLRLAQQLVENHDDFSGSCLVGIQPRGIAFSDRIVGLLKDRFGVKGLTYGKLDITFYRDDFRRREEPLAARETLMDFLVEGKKVVLIDDVLYTGRTIQAALTALQHYGRPVQVELMALVDRRFNRHLPIQADYIGLSVDSLDEAYVKVCWKEYDEEDTILMMSSTKSENP